MTTVFDFFQSNGNLVILNLILQITLLSGVAIALASRYKNNAVTCYGILFPALISLLLLTASSLYLQSRNTSLFFLPLEFEQTQNAAASMSFEFDELAMTGFDSEFNSLEAAGQGVVPAPNTVEENTITSWGLLLGLPFYLIFMGIWVGGFLVLTMGLLRSFHNIEKVSRNSSPLSLGERQRLDKLVAEVFPNKVRVPFRESNLISSPMLAGLLSPVILLPDNFTTSLNERQLMSVLLHELAHFERRDLLANFLQKVICTIFWFHPLVHLMDRMISRAREEICDNYVLARELPLDYSEALLHVSALASMSGVEPGDRKLTVGMFGNEWKLEQRIGELLNESRDRSMKPSRRTSRALQSLLFLSSLLLAACQLGVAESSDAADRAILVQEVANEQQDLERQRMRAAQRTIDQSTQQELAQRERRSPVERVSIATAKVEPLDFNSRELELETQAQEDERETLLRRQQQLKQELTGPAPAPAARTAGTLSPLIKEAIAQIQEYMQGEDSTKQADLAAAKALLDQLYTERFEAMNDFEKSTTLSFYTNYYLGTDNYPEAIRSFEQVLTIATLREDIRLRTLRSLGQLYAAVENWEASIRFYQQWREASPEEDQVTFRGLSYAHYQLEQFSDALPNWLSYMELVKTSGGELGRDAYAYLNGLYFTLEDFDSALELTKEMILLFNEPVDWQNLRALFKTLDSKTLDTQQNAAQAESELIGAMGANGLEPQISQATVVPADGGYLPLIAAAPQYPARAAQSGVEGWNLLAFTVDEEGNVIPETIKVKDADPSKLFNRASIRAASKFKYQPRIKDGQRMAVTGVEYLFRYRLPNDA